jgi:serine/threonine-protein kinase
MTPLDSVRYELAQRLFHEAVNRPAGERERFVLSATEDEDVRRTVAGMLAADADDGGILDRALPEVVGDLMDAAGARLQHDRFGPYRVTRLVGEGGMGVVYAGVRDDLGSTAAIKILRDAWLSPARRERFAAEQRLLAQLNHPNIARLYDAGTLAEGTPWLVMEYVDGVTLADHCRGGRRTLPDRLRLFRRVCEAVQYAHRQLVVHRDLKPSNILVTADGTVKLLDFGIAKQLENLDTPGDATRTSTRLMTPAYASPERLRGAATGVDADVYSLGVILYELLTDRLPFDVANRASGELEAAILQGDPPRPSTRPAPTAPAVGASAWADLDVLALTAMHHDATRRYPTVEAVLRDVDHFLDGQPLDARPDTLGYRLGKFLRRRWREVAAATIVLLAIGGLVTFYTVRLGIARNDAVSSATRAQRIQAFMMSLFAVDRDAGPSEDLKVTTLIERGAREIETLSAEPVVQADLYQTLGSIFQKLGEFDRSDALLATALERRTAIHGADSAEVAEALVARGLLRADQARFDDAERLAREGLAMAKRHAAPGAPPVIDASVALGRVLADRRQYDEAIAVLEEAARAQTDAGIESRDLADTLFELANAHYYAGHFDDSESLNRRALDVYRKTLGDRHPMVADCLINLGAVQSERGRYAEAETFYRQGLAITEAWYGRDHYKTAGNLTMLGRVLNRTPERRAEALEVLSQAVAIRERVYGPNHPNVASAVNELGSLALVQGRLDEAERHYRRAIDIYASSQGPRHSLVGMVKANLATVYTNENRLALAEQTFREVLSIYGETLPPTHTNVGIARIKLGRVLLREKRHAEAMVESRSGYDLLSAQMDPGVSWLQNARKDLIEIYTVLNQPAEAERFRTAPGGVAK